MVVSTHKLTRQVTFSKGVLSLWLGLDLSAIAALSSHETSERPCCLTLSFPITALGLEEWAHS